MELRSLGRYRLIRPLPVTNAVCRIYVASHDEAPEGATPGFLVKLLMPGAKGYEQLEEQFIHEGVLMGLMNHPCIPSLHQSGSQDGVRYIVMDYVDGIDLATLLRHHTEEPRGLSKEISVYVLGQLADALRHAHSLEQMLDDDTPDLLDVLHRDVCPANVLLSVEGDVLLSDFGSATSKLLAPAAISKQAGTRAYMAPERVVGTGDATVQTDLFSLSVVLWEMLKGQRCFREENDLKTMDAIVRFDISHANRRVQGLSPKLSEILRRNLDRDPARRYASAFQALQRLAQSPEAKDAEKSRLELAALVTETRAELERASNQAGTE